MAAIDIVRSKSGSSQTHHDRSCARWSHLEQLRLMSLYCRRHTVFSAEALLGTRISGARESVVFRRAGLGAVRLMLSVRYGHGFRQVFRTRLEARKTLDFETGVRLQERPYGRPVKA